MSKYIRGILVDTVRNTVTVADLNGSLSDYYRVLHCDCFDIAECRIGSKYFSIYCDDEGLLKDDAVISAVCDDDFSPMLVGNLFICNVDEAGNTIGLTEQEIESIMKYFRAVYDPEAWSIRHVLMAGY